MIKNKQKKIYKKSEIKSLLLLATMAGEIMLKNGAETYRVEDTINRLVQSRYDIKFVNAFVVPTGIIVSLEYNNEMMTYLTRINSIGLNLNKIDLVNSFSRDFVNNKTISVEEGIKNLKRINKTSDYSSFTKVIFTALACSTFTILLGGTIRDFIASYIVNFIVLTILNKISKYKLTFFINNFLGAMMATSLSVVSIKLNLGENIDTIIIGSIMSMLPGVAITNAMRDSMSGDFTSGLSRAIEAIFSALAIAFGVGVVLNLYLKRWL